MSVVLSVEETGPCEKRLRVEVPAATVEAEAARVAGDFRKRARIPGFRKGKVPMELVRKRFDEDIRKEVVDRLLPRYWKQAEAESRLDPLLPPTVGDVEFEPGAPLVFTATVEVRPEFPLGDLEGFDLPAPDVDLGAGDVDRMIEDLRRSVAPWVPVDRPAGQGDLVEANLLESSGEAVEPQAVAFEVGDPDVWEELSLEVSGKTAGLSGRFERLHAPGPEGGEEHRHEYQIELTAVKERELPPLDDALAAKIGKFETLEALREDVTRRLHAGKQQESRRRRERALLDQLRQRNPAELPRRVLEQEVRNMLTDYAESLGQRGVDPSRAEIDWAQLAEQVRPQAEVRVHARLLLDAVCERLEIEVPEELFEATLAGIARSQSASAAQLRRALDRDGRLAELRAQLRRERALKRLLGEEDAVDNGPGAALEPTPAPSLEEE
jgi:trigger factor